MTDPMTKGKAMKARYYVYEHYRKSDDVIFYVGVGQGRRFKSKDSRNLHWKRTVEKHGFYSKIVCDNISLKDAYELEIKLIKKYGKKNLCNITDGGDGVKNPKEDTRLKMSLAKIGKPQPSEVVEKRRSAIMSCKTRSNNKIGLKGVVWHKGAKKWAATASKNGKHIHLGLFDCTFAAWNVAMKWRSENK